MYIYIILYILYYIYIILYIYILYIYLLLYIYYIIYIILYIYIIYIHIPTAFGSLPFPGDDQLFVGEILLISIINQSDPLWTTASRITRSTVVTSHRSWTLALKTFSWPNVGHSILTIQKRQTVCFKMLQEECPVRNCHAAGCHVRFQIS